MCPFQNECKISSNGNKEFQSFKQITNHIQRHANNGEIVPESFFVEYGGSLCNHCHNYYVDITKHRKCRGIDKAHVNQGTEAIQNIPIASTNVDIPIASADDDDNTVYSDMQQANTVTPITPTLDNPSNDIEINEFEQKQMEIDIDVDHESDTKYCDQIIIDSNMKILRPRAIVPVVVIHRVKSA